MPRPQRPSRAGAPPTERILTVNTLSHTTRYARWVARTVETTAPEYVLPTLLGMYAGIKSESGETAAAEFAAIAFEALAGSVA